MPGLKTPSAAWEPVQAALEEAVNTHVFPGAALVVLDKARPVLTLAAGRHDYSPQAPAITANTVFDLASLTKPLATALVVMRLVERGALSLAWPLSRLLGRPTPQDKAGIRLGHLLSHTAGLPAWLPLYESLLAAPEGKRPVLAGELILTAPLAHAPGQAELYSDLGYILIGLGITRLTGRGLDELFQREVASPLGLTATGFLAQPPLASRPPASFPPTGFCPVRGGLVQGQVNDLNAWALGQVAGHAGLFGPAGEVAGLVCGLARALSGGRWILKPRSARLLAQPWSGAARPCRALKRRPAQTGASRLFAPKPSAPANLRALGFDRPSPHASSAGRFFPPHSLGHLGFTGTSFWLDPASGRGLVLFTNRTHPDPEANSIRGFRPCLHDLVIETLIHQNKSQPTI